MAILVSNATGNLSAASTWLLTNHLSQPNTATSTVTFSTGSYTAYFTPTNATDYCAGVLIRFYRSYLNSTWVKASLMEGAVTRATATINCMATTTSDLGTGWQFFKFAAPYQYGNTTAGTWRFKLEVSGGATSGVAYADGAGLVCYMEVSNTQQAPAGNDTLIVCGNGTTAGTFNAVTVTQDQDITLASDGSVDKGALYIAKGGTFNASTAASRTLTLSGNLIGESSLYGGTEGLDIDFSGTTNVYTLVFHLASDRQYGIINNSSDYSWRTSIVHWNRRSLKGNYAYNMSTAPTDAAPLGYHATLAVQANAGTSTLVLDSDMGLRAGGGDKLWLMSTNAAGQYRLVTTTAYDAGTKTVTISGTLLYTHLVGNHVLNLTRNVRIVSDNASYGYVMYDNGATPYLGVNFSPTLHNEYVEHWNFAGGQHNFLNVCDSEFSWVGCTFWRNTLSAYGFSLGYSQTSSGLSYAKHCCFFGNVLTVGSPPTTGLNANWLWLCASSYHSQPSLSTWKNIYIENPGTYGLLLGNFSYIENIYIWGCTNTFYLYGVGEYCVVKNLVDGSPIVNSSPMFLNYATYFYDIFFPNCLRSSVTNLFYPNQTDLLNAAAKSSDPNIPNTMFKFTDFNGLTGYHIIYTPLGNFEVTGAAMPDTLTRTTGQFAYKMSPLNTGLPMFMKIKKAVAASQAIVLQGYMRKNANYGSLTLPAVKLYSDDGAINASVTMTNVNDSWRLFSISGQVGAAATFFTIELDGQSVNASAACYFADMILVIGSSATGTATGFKVLTLWSNGAPTADETLGGTVDATFLSNSVWDTQTSAHVVSGSTGEELNTIKGLAGLIV